MAERGAAQRARAATRRARRDGRHMGRGGKRGFACILRDSSIDPRRFPDASTKPPDGDRDRDGLRPRAPRTPPRRSPRACASSSRGSCASRPRASSATARSSSRPTASRATASKSIVATGNVTLRQRGATIRADRVEYTEANETAIATGNVRLEREGDTATGPQLTYHLDNDTGEMEAPVFDVPEARRRGASPRAARPSARSSSPRTEEPPLPGRVHVLPGAARRLVPPRARARDRQRRATSAPRTTRRCSSSACRSSTRPTSRSRSTTRARAASSRPPSAPRARAASRWRCRTTGTSPRTATRRSRRRSSPSAACSWAASSATCEPKFAGQLDGEFLPNDRIADRDRYFVGVRHAHQLLVRHGTAAVNAQKVSDDDYFRDLSTRIAATSQTNLPRDAILAYGDDDWSRLGARARLPDAAGSARPAGADPLQASCRSCSPPACARTCYGVDWLFSGELSNFRHPTLVNGQRFIAYPSVALPVAAHLRLRDAEDRLPLHALQHRRERRGRRGAARARCPSRASTRGSSSTAPWEFARPRLPADARAAPLLPQRAVPRPDAACPTSPPRRWTSTSRRSSPRTASSAATASATRTSSRSRSPRA